MIACVASAPFTRSSSNHSSRKSAALIVNSRTNSCDVAPGPAAEAAGRPRPRRQPRAGACSAGRRRAGPSAARRHARSTRRTPRTRRRRACESFAMFSRSRAMIAPERERGAVRERHEVVGRDDRDVVAETLELELVDDPLRHQRHDVGRARHAVARPRLLGHRGAAQDPSALEDQRRRARPCARYAAHARPLCPPPTITTSCSLRPMAGKPTDRRAFVHDAREPLPG